MNNIINPYLYRNDGSYPQYKGLTSGINMLGDNKIGAGVDSMLQNLQQIEAAKIQDEKEKQAKFNDLIQTSLKDVHGQWRDEAVQMRNKFLNNATKIAAESQGNLTWEQQKQLEKEKNNLEEFANKSKAVNDWYAKAVAHTSGIKDEETRKQTAENIKRIMSGKSLDEIYRATQNPDWIATPKYNLISVVNEIPTVYKASGNSSVLDEEKTKESVKNAYLTGDNKIRWMRDEFNKIHPDKANDDEAFYDYAVQAKKATINSVPANKLRYYSTRRTGGTDKRDEVVNDNGVYSFRGVNKGKAVPMISVNIDGVERRDAHVVKQFKGADGKDYVRVVYAVKNKTDKEIAEDKHNLGVAAFRQQYGTDPTDKDKDEVAKLGEKEYQMELLINGKIPDGKSSTKFGYSDIPLTKSIDNTIAKYTIRNGYVPNYGETSKNTPKKVDENDPLGIL